MVPILLFFKRDRSIVPLILIIEVVIIEVQIGLTKIEITVRIIYLNNKGTVSIG